eukprot:31476-Pelagococcus_subviridis.AAC.8
MTRWRLRSHVVSNQRSNAAVIARFVNRAATFLAFRRIAICSAAMSSQRANAAWSARCCIASTKRSHFWSFSSQSASSFSFSSSILRFAATFACQSRNALATYRSVSRRRLLRTLISASIARRVTSFHFENDAKSVRWNAAMIVRSDISALAAKIFCRKKIPRAFVGRCASPRGVVHGVEPPRERAEHRALRHAHEARVHLSAHQTDVPPVLFPPRESGPRRPVAHRADEPLDFDDVGLPLREFSFRVFSLRDDLIVPVVERRRFQTRGDFEKDAADDDSLTRQLVDDVEPRRKRRDHRALGDVREDVPHLTARAREARGFRGPPEERALKESELHRENETLAAFQFRCPNFHAFPFRDRLLRDFAPPLHRRRGDGQVHELDKFRGDQVLTLLLRLLRLARAHGRSPLVKRGRDRQVRHSHQRPAHDASFTRDALRLVRPLRERGKNAALRHARQALRHLTSLRSNVPPVGLPNGEALDQRAAFRGHDEALRFRDFRLPLLRFRDLLRVQPLVLRAFLDDVIGPGVEELVHRPSRELRERALDDDPVALPRLRRARRHSLHAVVQNLPLPPEFDHVRLPLNERRVEASVRPREDETLDLFQVGLLLFLHRDVVLLFLDDHLSPVIKRARERPLRDFREDSPHDHPLTLQLRRRVDPLVESGGDAPVHDLPDASTDLHLRFFVHARDVLPAMKRDEHRAMKNRGDEPLADSRVARERFRVRDRIAPVVKCARDLPLRNLRDDPAHDHALAFHLDRALGPGDERRREHALGHASDAVVQDASLDFHLAPHEPLHLLDVLLPLRRLALEVLSLRDDELSPVIKSAGFDAFGNFREHASHDDPLPPHLVRGLDPLLERGRHRALREPRGDAPELPPQPRALARHLLPALERGEQLALLHREHEPLALPELRLPRPRLALFALDVRPQLRHLALPFQEARRQGPVHQPQDRPADFHLGRDVLSRRLAPFRKRGKRDSRRHRGDETLRRGDANLPRLLSSSRVDPRVETRREHSRGDAREDPGDDDALALELGRVIRPADERGVRAAFGHPPNDRVELPTRRPSLPRARAPSDQRGRRGAVKHREDEPLHLLDVLLPLFLLREKMLSLRDHLAVPVVKKTGFDAFGDFREHPSHDDLLPFHLVRRLDPSREPVCHRALREPRHDAAHAPPLRDAIPGHLFPALERGERGSLPHRRDEAFASLELALPRRDRRRFRLFALLAFRDRSLPRVKRGLPDAAENFQDVPSNLVLLGGFDARVFHPPLERRRQRAVHNLSQVSLRDAHLGRPHALLADFIRPLVERLGDAAAGDPREDALHRRALISEPTRRLDPPLERGQARAQVHPSRERREPPAFRAPLLRVRGPPCEGVVEEFPRDGAREVFHPAEFQRVKFRGSFLSRRLLLLRLDARLER